MRALHKAAEAVKDFPPSDRDSLLLSGSDLTPFVTGLKLQRRMEESTRERSESLISVSKSVNEQSEGRDSQGTIQDPSRYG